jgi:hypothetical protein
LVTELALSTEAANPTTTIVPAEGALAEGGAQVSRGGGVHRGVWDVRLLNRLRDLSVDPTVQR